MINVIPGLHRRGLFTPEQLKTMQGIYEIVCEEMSIPESNILRRSDVAWAIVRGFEAGVDIDTVYENARAAARKLSDPQ